MGLRATIIGMVLLLSAVFRPFSAVAGSDEQSIASWVPFITKESNESRARLADKGIEFGLIYVMDNITNVTGGTRRGGIEFGRFDPFLDVNLEKLIGWTGATFHANAYGLYGTGLTHTHLLNLATITETEALPDLRLYELWLEQTLWGGALAIKVGQQAADLEFFDMKRTTFSSMRRSAGRQFSQDLPAGGPSPPIAVPGVRLKAQLSEQITAFAAIFNGNPARPSCTSPPQLCDDHGLAFRVNDDPWLIGQTKFDYDLHLGNSLLPGNFTPGAWYHAGTFDDKHFTAMGLSIADPAGSGIPNELRGNYGVFATLEQTLYRAPGDTQKGVSATAKGITSFARVAVSPPDRNLIDFYADSGIASYPLPTG